MKSGQRASLKTDKNAVLTVAVDGRVWLLSTPVDCDCA